MRILKPFALYLVLSLTFCWLMGCGPDVGTAPTPQPGTHPLGQTIVRVINSSEWPASDLASDLASVNAQLQVVGQYWGINVQLQVYGGPFDASVSSILISDTPNPPGVSADGSPAPSPAVELRGGSVFVNYSRILAERSTSGSPEDYLSHAALLVAAGGPQIGEPYEAWAYGLVDGKPNQTPQDLCDWAFPAGGAVSPCTGQQSLDYAGYFPTGGH